MQFYDVELVSGGWGIPVAESLTRPLQALAVRDAVLEELGWSEPCRACIAPTGRGLSKSGSNARAIAALASLRHRRRLDVRLLDHQRVLLAIA